MASPVDTSVKHFTSAMPGAPVLTGSAGSLIALLDACLIDGFGLKSATSLVVAAGIATMTFSGGASAAVAESVILVSGATPTALNGEQRVLSATATTITFATALADGAASGSITFRMAPLGWLKPFAATNLAAYKSAVPESTGCYLRVNDSDTRVARVVGYESMTDVNTGSGSFPSVAQMSGGGYWNKSNAAGAVPIGWTIVGDGRTFYIYTSPYMGTGTPANDTRIIGSLRGFGDMLSYRAGGDAFACALSYKDSLDTSGSQHNGAFDRGADLIIAMPRGFSGAGGSVLTTSLPYTGVETAISGADSTLGVFPNAVDGSLRLSRRFLPVAYSSNKTPRCDVPGVYTVPQSAVYLAFSHWTLTTGSGPLSGRKLLAMLSTSATASSNPGATDGVSFVDITGPWR